MAAEAPASMPANPACVFFQMGVCTKGLECDYEHDPALPPVPKPEALAVCDFYSSGHCRYDRGCFFLHPDAQQPQYNVRALDQYRKHQKRQRKQASPESPQVDNEGFVEASVQRRGRGPAPPPRRGHTAGREPKADPAPTDNPFASLDAWD